MGAYYKPEPYLLVVTPDFRHRKVWTVFAADQCEAAFWGLGLRNGVAAMVGELYEGKTIVTDNALQRTAPRPTGGYLVVWKPEAEVKGEAD